MTRFDAQVWWERIEGELDAFLALSGLFQDREAIECHLKGAEDKLPSEQTVTGHAEWRSKAKIDEARRRRILRPC